MDIQTIVLSAILSLTAAIIASLISATVNHKNDVKKLMHDKRTSVYVEAGNAADQLILRKSLVYDSEYLMRLAINMTNIKLYASKDVEKAYKEFGRFAIRYNKSYLDFIKKHDPTLDKANYIIEVDSEGDEYAVYIGYKEDSYAYEKQLEEYKIANILDVAELKPLVKKLYAAMRKDLGSEL